MIDFEYAGRHLRGVWRLVSGDAAWRDDMDFTTEGVFRSFWAVALSAPFALFGFVAAARAVARTPEYPRTIFAKAPLGVLLAAEIATMVLFWAAAIAILAFGAQRLGASRNAAAVIVAFNWSQLLAVIAASAPALVLALTGNAALFAALALPVLAFSVFLLWVVLRRNLPLDVGLAVAMIAALIVVELALNSLVANGAIWLYQLVS